VACSVGWRINELLQETYIWRCSRLKKLRKIVVHGETYLWRHNYYDCDYSVPLYLLILLEKNRTAGVRIKFPLKDISEIEKCMLTSGFKATKNNLEVMINLNKPSYIAEIIQYLANDKIDFSKGKKHLVENGLQLLNEMGYTFVHTI